MTSPSHNPIICAFRAGQPVLSTIMSLPGGIAADAIAALDVDAVTIDMQHGAFGLDGIREMLMAVSARNKPALVRVPVQHAGFALIEQVLDAGALGIVAPVVESAQQAERVVAACRYPPRGIRSFGPGRAAYLGGGDYFDLDALGDVACIIQIESAAGLAAVEEILAVPGIDAVLVGPVDLAISLGLPLASLIDSEDPLAVEPLARIKRACDVNGVTAGIATSNGASAKRHLDAGFTFVTIGSDAGALAAGLRPQLETART